MGDDHIERTDVSAAAAESETITSNSVPGGDGSGNDPTQGQPTGK